MRERGKLQGSFVWDTTNKAEQQLQRRFAKRNFVPGETETAHKPFTYEGRPAHVVKSSSPDSGVIKRDQVERTENKGAKSQKANNQVAECVQPQKGKQETDNLQLPIAAKDQGVVHYNGQTNSPPPHLC